MTLVVGETPSASPGVSRRTSPSRESSPTLPPDSSTAAPQQMYDYSSSTDDMDFNVVHMTYDIYAQ